VFWRVSRTPSLVHDHSDTLLYSYYHFCFSPTAYAYWESYTMSDFHGGFMVFPLYMPYMLGGDGGVPDHWLGKHNVVGVS
jgi:hypothetical protein